MTQLSVPHPRTLSPTLHSDDGQHAAASGPRVPVGCCLLVIDQAWQAGSCCAQPLAGGRVVTQGAIAPPERDRGCSGDVKNQ